MTIRIISTDLGPLTAFVERFPNIANMAFVRSLNYAAKQAIILGTKQMNREINFPAGYLEQNDRFSIGVGATRDKLQVIISGRGRVTSLLRFAQGLPSVENTRGRSSVRLPKGQGGVRVMVKPGVSKNVEGAFVMRLKSGKTLTEDNFNQGLAVRLRPGEIIRGKYTQHAVRDSGIYLLYGPSVAQAFEKVAKDIAPEVTSILGQEFFRQFAVLSEEK